MGQGNGRTVGRVEWPTLLLICAVYAIWAIALWLLPLFCAIPVAGITIALHSSLQHEAIHGHPFTFQGLNDLLVWPPLALLIPYARFRATHLAHHNDETLTDPYDDPETNYLDPAVWDQLPAVLRWFLTLNNTLAGRLALGPLVGFVGFLVSDWRNRSAQVARGWLLHVPAVLFVLVLVGLSPMPFWAYVVAAYLGLSLLKLRTFLEHQAHERASGRSVIVEDRGPLAFLFLNNNLHVVHHMHPKIAWYDLPDLYRSRRDHYLRRNGGYYYGSYGDVMRRHLLRAKDPVPHPIWRRR